MTYNPSFKHDDAYRYKLNLHPVFYYVRWDGGGWFRFFRKWGLHWKDMRKSRETFSERYGYWKYIQIKHWRIKLLK